MIVEILVSLKMPSPILPGMTTFATWLGGGNIVWLDIIGLVTAVSLLEAALCGRGRTALRGHVNYWQVAPWLRPVLGIVGMVLLGLVVLHLR
jgi:hypothetical protein